MQNTEYYSEKIVLNIASNLASEPMFCCVRLNFFAGKRFKLGTENESVEAVLGLSKYGNVGAKIFHTRFSSSTNLDLHFYKKRVV